MMNNATFRKNVLATLKVKSVKNGLRYVLRNSKRVNTLNAATGLASTTGQFVSALGTYITGSKQLDDQMKLAAFNRLGECAYYLIALSRQAKYSPPGSGKKLKLKDATRTEAVLKLFEISNEVLTLTREAVFSGPRMGQGVRKRRSGEGFAEKVVEVIDLEASDEQWGEFEHLMADLLGQYSDLLWKICYSTFDVPPAHLYVAETARLAKDNPNVVILTDEVTPESEQEAAAETA